MFTYLQVRVHRRRASLLMELRDLSTFEQCQLFLESLLRAKQQRRDAGE